MRKLALYDAVWYLNVPDCPTHHITNASNRIREHVLLQ